MKKFFLTALTLGLSSLFIPQLHAETHSEARAETRNHHSTNDKAIGLKIAVTPSIGAIVYTDLGGLACRNNCTYLLGGFESEVAYRFTGFPGLYVSAIGGYYHSSDISNNPNQPSYLAFGTLGAKISYFYPIKNSNWVIGGGLYAAAAFWQNYFENDLTKIRVSFSNTGAYLGGNLDINYQITDSFEIGLSNKFSGLLIDNRYKTEVVGSATSYTIENYPAYSINQFIYQIGLEASYNF